MVCLSVLMWGPGRVLSLAAPVVLMVTMAGLVVTLSSNAPTAGEVDDRRARRHELRREARWW